ncbi:hypothetical protein D9757_008348 [Collybiopsis confluens]|uniref:F-box domain-containing protein n=1 Tax=Collybiopsis confluens TaxID=2823264 RepID=A0A8H5HEQ0_9AGAR|nr:hypothetical protein D9757_008348 [Collybiopsis confluens]
MFSLQSFSPEVLLKIFDGLPVEDVLNLSRVSHYLRQLSLCNRSFWTRADKTFLIPLPIGQTLKTIDISLIPQYFAQAVSISKNLQPRPKSISPEGSSKIQIAQPKRISLINIDNPFDPIVAFMRSAHLLPGHQLAMMIWKLSPEDPDTQRMVIMSLDRKFRFVVNHHFDEDAAFVWNSKDNGGLTWLALLMPSRNHSPSNLCIFEIRCDNTVDQPFSIHGHRIIQVPKSCSVQKMVMEGSLLVLFGDRDILVYDCKEGLGRQWLRAADSKKTSIEFIIISPSFVDRLWVILKPVLVNDDDRHSRTRSIVCIPLFGPDRNPRAADSEEEWSPLDLSSMSIAEIKNPDLHIHLTSLGTEAIINLFALFDTYRTDHLIARSITISIVGAGEKLSIVSSRETRYEDDANGGRDNLEDEGSDIIAFDHSHDTIYSISERSVKLLWSGARFDLSIPWKGKAAGGICELPFPEEFWVDEDLPDIMVDDVYGQMTIADLPASKLWLVQF